MHVVKFCHFGFALAEVEGHALYAGVYGGDEAVGRAYLPRGHIDSRSVARIGYVEPVVARPACVGLGVYVEA
jgi:hypothetical protein